MVPRWGPEGSTPGAGVRPAIAVRTFVSVPAESFWKACSASPLSPGVCAATNSAQTSSGAKATSGR